MISAAWKAWLFQTGSTNFLGTEGARLFLVLEDEEKGWKKEGFQFHLLRVF